LFCLAATAWRRSLVLACHRRDSRRDPFLRFFVRRREAQVRAVEHPHVCVLHSGGGIVECSLRVRELAWEAMATQRVVEGACKYIAPVCTLEIAFGSRETALATQNPPPRPPGAPRAPPPRGLTCRVPRSPSLHEVRGQCPTQGGSRVIQTHDAGARGTAGAGSAWTTAPASGWGSSLLTRPSHDADGETLVSVPPSLPPRRSAVTPHRRLNPPRWVTTRPCARRNSRCWALSTGTTAGATRRRIRCGYGSRRGDHGRR